MKDDPIARDILEKALFEAAFVNGTYLTDSVLTEEGRTLFGNIELNDGRTLRLTIEELPW